MKAANARVVITGAAGGIGAASAEALLKAGAAVMLVGRSAPRLEDLARELGRVTGARPAQVACRVADLTQPKDLDSLSAQAAAWCCNVLVHNAGLPAFGRLQDQTPAQITAALQTNLLAPMLLTRGLLPHLLAQPAAQVICVGSALGAIGMRCAVNWPRRRWRCSTSARAPRRPLSTARPPRLTTVPPAPPATARNGWRASW
jgi:short-subunit dehydrogenase